MEKPRFEEHIRRKLDGYSSSTSPGLWDKLDSSLSLSERKRKNISRIRYAAMAAMFALVVLAYSRWPWDYSDKSERETVAVVKQPTGRMDESEAFNSKNLNSKKSSIADRADDAPSLKVKKVVKIEKANNTNPGSVSGLASVKNASSLPIVIDMPHSLAERSINTKVPLLPLDLNLSESLNIRVVRDLSLAYKFADVASKIDHRKKEPVRQASWLAVGFASGSYQQQVLTGARDAGSSRSSAVYYGRNFGRLALFTGLAFAEQEYNRSSNLAYGASSVRKAISSEMITSGVAATADLSATNTYLVNTQKRYLSVPVQAGWFVVDGKVKGMLSAGIMSDYFLNSTQSDVSGVLQASTVRRGIASSYAGWVFSGIAGTEWSMEFSDRYQIAVSPGVRYALTPVYRKDFLVNGKSYAFDVGVRLRYFFDR